MRGRLCLVKLGAPCLQTDYRHDFVARHWWLDLWRWRLCAIWRNPEAA